MNIAVQYAILIVCLLGIGALWGFLSKTPEVKARARKGAILFLIVGVLAYTAQYFTMG